MGKMTSLGKTGFMFKTTPFFWSFIVLLVLGSCQNNQDASQTGTNTGAEATTDQPEALYTTYETFDEIAPLFAKQTDTTYVINFWATWCKPCVEELPYFERLYDEYQGENVKIVLVSLDFPNQIESKLIPFLEERQLGPDIALLLDDDINSWGDYVNPEWGGAIPITLVYQGNNKSFHGTQYASYDELKEMVEQML